MVFGRRTSPPASAGPPPPLPVDGALPTAAMRDALDAVIRRCTAALDRCGMDCGALADRAPAGEAVEQRLVRSICFEQQGEPLFLALSLTRDFKRVTWQPHFRLFMMTSALHWADGILAEPSDLAATLVRSQVPRALLDAHLMKFWVGLIEPVARAQAAKDEQALIRMAGMMFQHADRLVHAVPSGLLSDEVLIECGGEWCSGWPMTFSLALTPETRRRNGLPVTPETERQIVAILAQWQGDALNAERARG